MIWSLAREQVRSQWRYVVAAAVVITVAVGLAAYAGIMTVTLGHSQAAIDHLTGVDRESFADATTETTAEFEALAPHIDAANEQGHNVVAQAAVWPALPSEELWESTIVVSLYGDADWSEVLMEGTAPAAGEIAVSAQWAKENGLDIGDDVGLVTESAGYGESLPVDASLKISGLMRSPVATAGVQLYLPAGWVAWDDVPALNEAWNDAVSGGAQAGDDFGENVVGVTIYGDGAWPWSSELAASSSGGSSSSPASGIATVAAIGFGALVIGLIAMAFALGRAQAQARTKWLGTVRAMGASKRQVAAASVLESVLVGVAAGAAGFVLGAVAAAVHLAVIAARVESPMILAVTSSYAALAGAAVVLATVLSLIVGSVPAFWSTRVSPTAALKPVTDLSEATVSRRVRVWPLALMWLVSALVVGSGFATDMFSSYAVVVLFAAVVLGVTSVMGAHEVLRHTIVWHARRLSRSSRRVLMVAGDAMLARPRQSTIPAFIVALSSTVVLALMGLSVATWAVDNARYMEEVGEVTSANPYISALPLVGIYAVVTLLCVAVAIATAAVSAREAATRQALGLTAREGRLAAALQYLVAQAHGLGLGLVGGALGVTMLLAVSMASPMLEFATWRGPLAQFISLTALVCAAAAVVGAAITAAFAPKTAPLSRVEVSA